MACEWVAPSWCAGPFGPRNVIGILNCPPDIVSMFGALFTTWSKATNEKLKVMNSMIGRSPTIAAPTPMPAKPFSLIGVSMIRFGPKRSSKPWLTL